MVIFVYARIVIFLGLVVHVISAEECFPVFNEISSLGSATIASTQFLELSLSQGCNKNSFECGHCNVCRGRAREHFMNFYNSVAKAVRELETWPTDLRRDKNSIRFYKTLLDDGDALGIPHVVIQAIKCILVIPASNADPERSFSTANRLTRGERSSSETKTLDSLMRVQRDGPSVLTVTPKTLAEQWLNPLPDLGLSPHMPSTFKSSDSFMKLVKESIISGAAQDLVKLSAQHSMILQKLNSRPDAHVIRLSKEDHETAKAMIFSSDALRDDHNIDRDIP